jgi:hypothetical protein
MLTSASIFSNEFSSGFAGRRRRLPFGGITVLVVRKQWKPVCEIAGGTHGGAGLPGSGNGCRYGIHLKAAADGGQKAGLLGGHRVRDGGNHPAESVLNERPLQWRSWNRHCHGLVVAVLLYQLIVGAENQEGRGP